MNKLDKEFLELMESLPPLAIQYFKMFLDLYKLRGKGVDDIKDLNEIVSLCFLDLHVSVVCASLINETNSSKASKTLDSLCEVVKKRVFKSLKEIRSKN